MKNRPSKRQKKSEPEKKKRIKVKLLIKTTTSNMCGLDICQSKTSASTCA